MGASKNPAMRDVRPTPERVVAELKARTGLDGYAVELDDERIDAYSYASSRNGFGAATAALYWRRGQFELRVAVPLRGRGDRR